MSLVQRLINLTLNESMNKTCRGCKENKPLDSFYTHSHTADGRQGKCKECIKSYTRNHYKQYTKTLWRNSAPTPKKTS